MRTRAFLTILLLLAGCCLNGCWDQQEITSLAPITGLGVDAGDQPGMYKISVQITAGGGGDTNDGSAETKLRVLTVDAETVEAGIMQLQPQLRRAPFLLHLNFIALGEELARSGIEGVLASLQASPQIRASVPLLVAAGSAEAVLAAHSGIARAPGQDISDLLEGIAEAPIGVRATILDAINAHTIRGTELALPILDLIPLHLESGTSLPDDGTGQGGERYTEVKMERTALFDRNRFVATLDRLETNILSVLLGAGGRGMALVPNPANPIRPLSILYERLNVFYQISVDGPNPPQVIIKPRISIRLLEVHGGYDLATRGLEPIERAVELDIEQQIERLLIKLQQSGLDTLGLGQKIANRYPSAWSDLEPLWTEIYPEIPISVEVTADVRVTGMLRKFHQTER